MVIAFIGLGANLGQPQSAIEDAIVRIDRTPNTRVLRRARLYRSTPLGPPGQPDYVNTVVELETLLEANALLGALKTIERDMGRTTSVRWGPRVIDLDIILYGDFAVKTPDLVIPHEELAHRRFVLKPLADLAPGLVVPGIGYTIQTLLAALNDDCECIELDSA